MHCALCKHVPTQIEKLERLDAPPSSLDVLIERGEMVDLEPVAETTDHGDEVLQSAGFEKIRSCSHVKSAFDIFVTDRGGQNDNRKAFEQWLLPNPGQDVKTVFHRHVKVQ